MASSRGTNATRPETNDSKHGAVPTHGGHHASDPQQHCSGVHPVASAAPHPAQQLQVRQVLSVYVDNRCRCGSDRHQTLQPTAEAQAAQHRPQSFPVSAGIYGTRSELGGPGHYAPVPQHVEQDIQCCHCMAQPHAGHACGFARNYACNYTQIGRHCHVVDDNVINQSIYMSAKEARIQQQQMLYAKNQSLMLITGNATRVRDPVAKEDPVPAKDAVVAPLENPQQKRNPTHPPPTQEISAVPASENGTVSHQHQRQNVLEVPDRSAAAAAQSPASSIGVEGSELPASFDSVTLKRMLRSLSGSPSIDSSAIEPSSSDSKQGTNVEQSRLSDQSSCSRGGLSIQQFPQNPALKTNSSSVTQDQSAEPLRLNHFQTDKEPVDGKSGPPDENSTVNEAIPSKKTEKERDQSFSKMSFSAQQGNSFPNGCLVEWEKKNEMNREPIEAFQSEAASVGISRDVCQIPSNGITSAERTPNEFQEVLSQNTTKQDDEGKKAIGDEASANKEAVISHSDPCGRHQRMDSGSWTDTPEVHRLTMSDLSGSECGSDGEGAASDCSSIYTVPMQVAFISPSMALRKAGWLMVKNWLVHRKRSVELAAKRTWNKYWVCLKGNVLLFHVCDDGEEVKDDRAPKYRLVLEGALAQAVPEHPKKENIFSLSTAFGDAYLFQANDQTELSGWIGALHTACAASFFRQHGRENILRLLQNEIHRMESSIDLDLKMKKMATMHLTTVSDIQSRLAIEKQITQWEENLEKLYVEHYRLRFYVSSMKNTEPPNPKTLLSYVSKNTKVVLGRVGVFTVNAFHALVCARAPLSVNSSVPSSQKPCCLLSTFKSDVLTQNRAKTSRNIGLRPVIKLPGSDRAAVTHPGMKHSSSPPTKTIPPSSKSFVRVRIAGSQVMVTVELNERTTVYDLVDYICKKQELNITDHFLQLKLRNSNSIKIPDKTVHLCNEEYDLIELCTKLHFQIELTRSGKDKDFGFRVSAELTDELEHPDSLCVFINEITRCGMAYRKGLVVGDEILVINGQVVTQLDMVFIENLLQDVQLVSLTVRSCRVDRASNISTISTNLAPNDQMDQPSDHQMALPASSSSSSSSAQVPLGAERLPLDAVAMAVNSINVERKERTAEIPDLLRTKKIQSSSSEPADGKPMTGNQLPHTCRHQCAMKNDNANVADYVTSSSSSSRPLSNSQRICKVILELIDTERLYVRDLMCLIERYLEPLKQETYLSCEDISQLFGNIQEIVQFQKLFLRSLEEAVSADPNFNVSQEPEKFKDEDLRQILVLISSSFVYYAHHFKLYSSFCASHSKAQKMILSDDNVALQEFLKSRNPKQQHSATLESYLIKPIQRIVKYPLLLKQLYELTDAHSKEHFHLREALHGMEAVAEHINEMQKIYEEYGNIFEELMRHHHKQGHSCNKVVDLNVGELQMYGTVNWINAVEELGKLKKSTDLLTLVFIFKSAIVLLAQERQKFKKKTKASGGRPAWGCESSELTRFKLAIPVDQLQVRTVVGDVNDRHGIWEVVHCHNEKEGRPKKVYQFLSSQKARNDFIRTIHHTMHESVRRISVAGLKTQQSRIQQSALHRHHHQNQHQHADMDNTTSKDANSNVADSVAAQMSDNRNGCTTGGGGSTSPVRRGVEFFTGPEGRERAACSSTSASSTSPSNQARRLVRDTNAPTSEPTSLAPRQVNSAK